MADVAIRWLSSSQRDAAAHVWRELEARLGDWRLTCSWPWTDAWLTHYGDAVPHRFAVGDVDGRPCAVALVTRATRRRGPLRLRSLHVGTAGEPPGHGVFVEYNRLLADPASREGFATALLRDLGGQRGWDELCLDGFEPDEAAPLLRAHGSFECRRLACPTTDLRGAPDVLSALRSDTRRKVRRGLAALGDVETEWARTPEHALDVLDELAGLHQRRWTAAGEPGAFASARFTGFHRALVARLVARDSVVLFRARARGETVGCLYHHVERGRVLFYQSGLAWFGDRRVSPGFVTFALCMQACAERGLEEYDFLAPDSRYKRDLATGTKELVWAEHRRSSWRWAAYDRLAALRRRSR